MWARWCRCRGCEFLPRSDNGSFGDGQCLQYARFSSGNFDFLDQFDIDATDRDLVSMTTASTDQEPTRLPAALPRTPSGSSFFAAKIQSGRHSVQYAALHLPYFLY